MPQIRDRIYNVIHVFYSDCPSVTVGINDIVYTNIGDNNFYLEQKRNAVIQTLDWALAKKAIRYGWLELLKVESDG